MNLESEQKQLYRPRIGDEGNLIANGYPVTRRKFISDTFTVKEINGNSVILDDGTEIKDYLKPQMLGDVKILFFNVTGYWRVVMHEMFRDLAYPVTTEELPGLTNLAFNKITQEEPGPFVPLPGTVVFDTRTGFARFAENTLIKELNKNAEREKEENQPQAQTGDIC